MIARPVNHTNHLIVSSRFHHFHHHHFIFGNCFGFSCNPFLFNAGFGFPLWGSPFFDPFYSGNYAPSAPEQPVASNETSATDVQLAVEMQRLADEVEELRDQQRTPQPVMKTVTPQGSISAQPPAESTTFVFRDGRRISTQNFAIVDHTLWILSQHTAKKVPLTDLDREATEQANAANGVELRLP